MPGAARSVVAVMNPLIDRLSRRGKLTIVAVDGEFKVELDTPGPYGGRGSCTTDKADYWSHCDLGAPSHHDEGDNLDELLENCELATRPHYRDVDELRGAIELRRESRTYGPPLPSYMRWGWGGGLDPWRPGQERWLRTSSHAHEYLDGYARDIADEKALEAERAEYAAKRERARVQRVLEG